MIRKGASDVAGTFERPSLPRVAVCLAAYNGMRWISEQITSILAQTSVHVTIFVSVDHSSDGTEQWIEDLARADQRIVPLPHGEKFGGAARNFFRLLKEVDFSLFDYVSLADQDDVWHLDKLSHAVSTLHISCTDVYSSNVTAFWPSGRQVLIDKSQPQRKRDFLFEAAGPGCTYVMSVSFARTLQEHITIHWSDLQSVGLHDWFIYAYARANRFRWTIDVRPGMSYRQHAENQVGVNQGWRAFVHRVGKIQSGWGFAQALLIARLVGMQNDMYALALQRGRYLWLAAHAHHCRRRLRDRIWFAASCLLVCLTGSRGNG